MRLKANDLAILLNCSTATATNLIRKMNNELEKMGYLIIRGSVPKKYAYQRLRIEEDEIIEESNNEKSN